ncbi:family 78 glycoside hydrolase catalytic domain [uncultured Duncaniella sp.]|jgi:alpha-L-rhamnosidase|uniref:family 78 glycoside hydrolase catalytic domain n=1 Tax=uncultured Duncaniella sp. TaxID=2768039 RepID=UPI0025B07D39|nr:family 78 glycoside hydrolase catalytic domain [uncultured Duncaniella sp.]
MMYRISTLLLALLIVTGVSAGVNVGSLTTEGLVCPLNVETPNPRLSWIITSSDRDVMQTAYHILVASSPEKLAAGQGDIWNSGKVFSDRSVWVEYTGPKLADNTRCYWKVKVSTTRGDSSWSPQAEWGMGIVGEGHWGGRWIGWEGPFEWDIEDSHSRMSSRYLRKEFNSEKKEIKRATAHISGLGLYELYINGQKVGDDVLAPAPTDYRRTTLYNSYDVTDLLKGNGEANAVGVTLGNGRFYTMRQNYKPYKIPTFGYPKMRMNMIIEYTDGTKQRVNSDEKWSLTAKGPIRSNNEYDGEIYDARLDLGDWTKPGYDDSKWLKAQRAELPFGTLRGNTAPNMKVMKTLTPKSVRKLGDRFMVDFGQNMAGWVKIAVSDVAKGDTVVIRYSERISPDSTRLDVENLRHAQSTDRYIANGTENGAKWSPKFSYHGFQFVEVTGVKDLKPEDIVAEFVYDALPDNGSFASSNKTMNAIHRNAWWGIASNYKGVPVDCPQRDERQPWTGDHNMGTWGENFLFDNANMYAKWMDDMRESQREDGCLPDIAPAFYNYYTSDMTWSSTLPVVSDMIYEQTGNPQPIIRNYDAMKKWMNHIRTDFTNKDGLITADKYGDWCVPPEKPDMIHSQDPARKTDGTLIASAYYYKMCQLMAKFARIQGLDAEASAWESDADKVKNAFNKQFLTVKKGTSPVKTPHILYPDSIFYGNNTATANVLPLAFDMVPEEYRQPVADNLIKTIIETNKGHISTGVIGVNWLMRELSRIGRGDVAAMLASNTSYPSYGYEISKGATTIWELWNGDTASRKMNSNNHVMMLGDHLNWYYQDLAGFNPAKPGYKEILLKPDFSIQQLDSVNASYRTPYGLLASRWVKTPMHIEWRVEIPCNTTAVLCVPTPDKKAVKAPGAKYMRSEGLNSYWSVGSGVYNLDIKVDPSLGDKRKGILNDEFLYETASFPECHGATIVELDNGDLVASFFGGTKERNPDCVIWVCRKPKGATEWSEPVIAADGVFDLNDPNIKLAGLSGINAETTPATAGPVGPHFKGDINNARRKACWNPVLFQIPGEKELMLFYKIGSSVGDWTGWVVRSTDGGKTWSDREPLPEGILGPIKNKPEYINGRIISPSSREGNGWRAWIEISDDKGKTWHTAGALPSDSAIRTDRTEPEPIYAIQPSILRHSDGRLQILCRTRNSKIATSWSSDNGDTWTPVTLIDMPNNNSGTDAVTLKDGRHVLIYNDFATLPGTPKGVRNPLCVAVSDDGIHWENVMTLEDSPVSQYSYPSIIQGKDGKLHAIYTWRRQRVKYARLDL